MPSENQVQTATESGFLSGQNKCQWTVEEKKALAAVTFPLIEMQKAYGREMDAKLVMQGWEIKFAGRYTVEQILYAIDRYTDKRDDFPSPANLIAMLEPEEPRVTEAEFIAAQKYQERNNWPMMSDAQDTIDLYRKQNDESRKEHRIECEKIQKIVSNSVKRINHDK